MMMKAAEVTQSRQIMFRFSVWRASPRVMPWAHVHTDIEVNLLTRGRVRYFFAGRFHDLVPGQLAVFWAGMPHRLVEREPGTEYLCVILPLAWFLGWGMDTGLRERLLRGDLLEHTDDAGADTALLERWARDLEWGSGGPEAERIVLLELEARLRRLAQSAGPPSERTSVTGSEGKAVERLAAYLSAHYQDPELSAARVAGAVGLHPHYAMAVFKTGCGATMGEYLARLRVSHAQRLLLTSNWTVQRIALECGWGSASRFFAVFGRVAGCTPHQYRVRQGG